MATREQNCKFNREEQGDKPCRRCADCVTYYRGRESDAWLKVSEAEARARATEVRVAELEGGMICMKVNLIAEQHRLRQLVQIESEVNRMLVGRGFCHERDEDKLYCGDGDCVICSLGRKTSESTNVHWLARRMSHRDDVTSAMVTTAGEIVLSLVHDGAPFPEPLMGLGLDGQNGEGGV